MQAVVFDIGGVLEITPPTGWRDRWREQRGIPEEQFDGRLRDLARPGSVGEISYEYYVEQVRTRLGLDATAADAFMDELWAEYLGTPNTVLIDYFTGLRGRVRTGILSNSFVGAREREQERYGFGDRCDVVVYSHEEGLMKPDPAFYAVVCERLGVGPEETVFVDDLDVCIRGAEAIGMTGVLHRDNATTIAAVEAALARPVTARRDDG
ncbi:MAG TPA: HAD family phosphatase [Egicoccus sp.]|nr:HAD family phosphatase [Egicoccus sp.]HSK22637.1 HAD family phosphatase [Egicoccus sp.]